MRRAILFIAPALLALGLAQPLSAQTCFAVATGEGTNAVSIAKFRNYQVFGTELMVSFRIDLFYEQPVETAEIVLGSGDGGGAAVLDFADTLGFDLGFISLAIITSEDLVDGDLSDLIADFEAGKASLVLNTAESTLSGPIFCFSSQPSDEAAGDAPGTDPDPMDPASGDAPPMDPPGGDTPPMDPAGGAPPPMVPPTT